MWTVVLWKHRGDGMGVLGEALEFLGLTEDSRVGNGRYELVITKTRKEQRELAATMRRLPDRFADRLSAQDLQQVRGAAAAGQWERAIDELITALHARSEAVTGQECEELRAVLEALAMPAERIDAVARR